ncbi:M55 family metallopeptidase [bacterium]|nr:M55 family metallopeptidase [bacterium]
MRFFISFDMEGVAALTSWPAFTPKGPDYAYARRQATAEVNAVICGLKAGAEEAGEPVEGITVADSHAQGLNLIPEELPREVNLLRGFPRPNYMVEGLLPEHDLACFVGYHSRVGQPGGLMDHSYSGGTIYEVRLNGRIVGETELNAAYAAHYGVPVGLISGDAALEDQVAESLGGGVVFVRTKVGITRFAAVCEHPENVLEKLREGAEEAVRRRNELPLYRVQEPLTLEVDLTETQMADLLELFPGFERVGGRRIRITSPEMPVLYRAYMGLLLVAWSAKRIRQE